VTQQFVFVRFFIGVAAENCTRLALSIQTQPTLASHVSHPRPSRRLALHKQSGAQYLPTRETACASPVGLNRLIYWAAPRLLGGSTGCHGPLSAARLQKRYRFNLELFCNSFDAAKA